VLGNDHLLVTASGEQEEERRAVHALTINEISAVPLHAAVDDKTTIEREHRRGSAPRASLILYHRDGAKVATLVKGSVLVVGRAHPADVVVNDASLSRKHARFGWEDDGFFVEDLKSTNGTRLAGVRITAKTRLPAGEAVTAGDVTVALQIVDGEQLPGIEGHDKFTAAVEDEIVRARTFARSFSLAMVRGDRHLRHWVQMLREKLRPVDRIGAYSDDAVLVLIPEQPIAVEAPPLRVGTAIYPTDGQSAEELIDAARGALRGERRTSEPPPSAAPVNVDPRMREVWDTVARVATSNLPVVINGETGTGKELVARAIHRESGRKGALRSVNCAALPATLLEATLFGHEKGAFTGADRAREGVFEQANGGTAFLDEVGELAPAAQAALLRVLEAKTITRVGGDRDLEVDVRVVAATHRDLESMCEAGTFRWDLLYRLNAVTIQLPPLRERAADIIPLAETFLREAARENGRAIKAIDVKAANALRRHRWPGNVRELRNVIERAVVIARGDAITVDDLPPRLRESPEERKPSIAPDGGLKEQMRAYEIQLIVDALKKHGGNQTEAARALQMPVRTLAHKMQTYGIKKTFER
jgi:two-component system, NtrC family, response regulator AtoC